MNAWYYADFSFVRTDLVQRPEVGALAVFQVELAERLLLERRDGGLDLPGLLFFAPFDELRPQLLQSLAATPPIRVDDSVLDPVEVLLAQLVEERVLIAGGDELLLLLAVLGGPAFYRLALLADGVMGEDHRLDHDLLRDLVRAGFDHRDRLFGPRHDEVEVSLGDLLVSRVEYELAVERASDPDGAYRAVEREVRERQRRRRPDHAHGVVGGLLVRPEHGADDLDLVAVALREEGPKRSVDEPASEYRPLARPPLALEEAARDLAGRRHTLLDVHAQRQKVYPGPRRRRPRRRREHHGVAESGRDGAASLAGELPGFEHDLTPANGYL